MLPSKSIKLKFPRSFFQKMVEYWSNNTKISGQKIGASILCLGGGPSGVLRISSDGEVRRIFLGLKFTISGFFLVRKFWQVFSLEVEGGGGGRGGGRGEGGGEGGVDSFSQGGSAFTEIVPLSYTLPRTKIPPLLCLRNKLKMVHHHELLM